MEKERLITFETAKLAKQKGFDFIQRYGMEASLYSKDGKPTNYANYGVMYSGLPAGYISAPTQFFLQKWLRETHNIHISIFADYDSKDNTYNTFWNCNIIDLKWGKEKEHHIISTIRDYDKCYEDCLEKGLKKALKKIINKTKKK